MYRKVNSKIQIDVSTQFSQYLVLACWRKMQSRIGHWAIVGLMHQLARTSHKALLCMNIQSSTHSDNRLVAFLDTLNMAEELYSLLSHYQSDHADGVDILHCFLCASNQRPCYIPEIRLSNFIVS